MAAIPTFQQFQAALRGTPMQREAKAIYNTALRGGLNPAFVAGLASAESSFGRKGYAVGSNNPFGLGVHLGWKFPSYAAATAKLAKTLSGLNYPQLFRKGGLAGIISQYTPASDGNDEAAHARNIINAGRTTGGNAAQVYVSGGTGGRYIQSSNEMPGAAAPMSGAAAPAMTMRDPRLGALLARQYNATARGEYNPELMREVGMAIAADTGMRLRAPAGGMDMGGGGAAAAPAPAGAVDVSTLGVGAGNVDSGKIMRGGAGGNWGGSMDKALQFLQWAEQSGYKPNTSGQWLSQKRSRVRTASGGVSDHYVGNTSAYAVDLGVPNVKYGDTLLRQIMSYFGQPNYRGGSWLNVNRGGYRFQIGWRVPGHYDHIHVGVKRG